jgi:hypothetical protein
MKQYKNLYLKKFAAQTPAPRKTTSGQESNIDHTTTNKSLSNLKNSTWLSETINKYGPDLLNYFGFRRQRDPNRFRNIKNFNESATNYGDFKYINSLLRSEDAMKSSFNTAPNSFLIRPVNS